MVTRGKAPTVWAYAAGILDGEGSITIKRTKAWTEKRSPRYVASVTVGGIDKPLIEWFQQEFGGSVIGKKPTQATYRPVWVWDVASRMAVYFLTGVLPYMKVKRQQAECVLELMDSRYPRRRGSKPVDSEELARRERLYFKVRALNAGLPATTERDGTQTG